MQMYMYASLQHHIPYHEIRLMSYNTLNMASTNGRLDILFAF